MIYIESSLVYHIAIEFATRLILLALMIALCCLCLISIFITATSINIHAAGFCRDEVSLLKFIPTQVCKNSTKMAIINTVVSTSTPIITIIFTVYNKPELITKALLSLFTVINELPLCDIVVVDDSSIDDMTSLYNLVHELKNKYKIDITILRNGVNKGFGFSNNQAIQFSVSKYALLLNTDVKLLPGTLSLLYWTMLNFPKAGAIGPLMLKTSGAVVEAGSMLFHQGHHVRYGYNSQVNELPLQHARRVDYISAACLLIRRDIFFSLGLFDPHFEPAYYEDSDASLTLLKNGWSVDYYAYTHHLFLHFLVFHCICCSYIGIHTCSP